MEKIKNFIILFIEIVVAVSILVFAAIYIGASRTEGEYQKANTLMSKSEWSNALTVIEKIPHYKDSSELYIYVYGNSIYCRNYATMDEMINGYRICDNYISENYKNLSSKKYKDGFNELHKVLSFKVEELNNQKQYNGIASLLNDSVNMIRKGDLIGAAGKLNAINTGEGENNTIQYEKEELLRYIDLLNAVNLNDNKAIVKCIGELNPSYNGVMKEDISSTVQLKMDLNQWYSAYKGDLTSQNIQIGLGMKREDVVSALGNPNADELINNSYGDFERMSYKNRILYFEKNILSAIKE